MKINIPSFDSCQWILRFEEAREDSGSVRRDWELHWQMRPIVFSFYSVYIVRLVLAFR